MARNTTLTILGECVKIYNSIISNIVSVIKNYSVLRCFSCTLVRSATGASFPGAIILRIKSPNVLEQRALQDVNSRGNFEIFKIIFGIFGGWVRRRYSKSTQSVVGGRAK